MTTADALRYQANEEGWTAWQLVHCIEVECSVSRLRAQRLARGWTLQEVADGLRRMLEGDATESLISHQRISQWETGSGRPNARYLDALCRLYATRPDRMGFGKDYTADEGTASLPLITNTNFTEGAEGEAVGKMVTRRTLVRAVAGIGVTANAAQILGTMERIRQSADSLLLKSGVPESTVEELEMRARELGFLQLTMPFDEYLTAASYDFAVVTRALSQRQPIDQQRRMYRVMAQLAGLIACVVNAGGESRAASAWFYTARLAADESEYREVRAWVMGYEGMSHLWFGRSPHRAIELSRRAQKLIGATQGPIYSLASAIEARGQARIGNKRESMNAIIRSSKAFDQLQLPRTEANVLGFYEQLLRYYEGEVLTTIGETRSALDSHDRGLALSSEGGVVDAAMIKLDRAACLMQMGQVEEGCQSVVTVMTSSGPDVRRGAPVSRARMIANDLQRTGRPGGSELSELISSFEQQEVK